MLIEVVGGSGAGKTTLVHHLTAFSDRSCSKVMNAREVVARSTHIQWMRPEVVQNCFLDVLLLPSALRLMHRKGPRWRCVVEKTMSRGVTLFDRISRGRAAIRQAGRHAVLSDLPDLNTWFVVDEGILGMVHSLLVPVKEPVSEAEIIHFADSLPWPDVVVHLDTPLEVCLQRTRLRRDKPLRGALKAHLETFVSNAHQAYRCLGRAPAALDRWLTIQPTEEELVIPELLASRLLHLLTGWIQRRDLEPRHRG